MSMIIRVTGVLIEDKSILLLDQNTTMHRSWSLPGGKVELDESLETAILREMKEETGLEVSLGDLLYVCDYITVDTHVLHITFLVERTGGHLGEIDKTKDKREIRRVALVPIIELQEYGFSQKFQELVINNFPARGSYRGPKKNIGL